MNKNIISFKNKNAINLDDPLISIQKNKNPINVNEPLISIQNQKPDTLLVFPPKNRQSHQF
jgi:hypothetical protein